MLRVRYGPFPALERSLEERLKELKSEDTFAPVAVVAPSRLMADRLQRFLALERGLALLNVHFLTFHSLAERICAETPHGGRGSGGIIGINDSQFLDRAIDSLLEERTLGSRFGGAIRPRALASALRSSLKDLLDAGIRPGELLERFDEGFLGEGEAARRLKDLLELGAALESWLGERGLMAPAGLAAAAADAAEASAYLASFKEILYYGAYDFTGMQLELLERVSSAHPVTFFFPYRKDDHAFHFCEGLFKIKLHRDGGPAALPEPPAGPLAAAMDVLFAAKPPARPAPEGALRLFNASGVRDEAWKAAKEILRLHEEEGVPFEDIGVVARSLEPYRAALLSALSENAIPFALAEGTPLKRRPIAGLCLGLLTLRRRDFPADAVAAWLQSPYSRREGPSLARGLRRLGVRAGWLAWEARLGRLARLKPGADEDSEARPAFEPEEASELLKRLQALREGLSPVGRKPWSEWAAYAQAFLREHVGLPAGAAPEEGEAWEAVLGHAASLAAFDPLGETDWDFFVDALVDRLERAGLDDALRRGVRVLGAMDARGESFRVLFLLGLHEGFWPRQVREDPLLRDESRAKLRHPGGYWIGRKLDGVEEERLLFRLAAGSAGERLYASWCRSDEEGRALTPSLYLRELLRAAGAGIGEAEAVPRQPWARLAQCPAAFLTPQEARLSAAALGEGADARIRALNSFDAAGPFDGLAGPPRDYLKLLLRKGLSPSALDRFAQCPFRFFAGRVLGLEEREEPLEKGELAPAAKGKLYHKILERFYKRLNEDGFLKRPRLESGGQAPAFKAYLAQAADSVFAQNGWRDLGMYPAVWEAARLSMLEALSRFIRWDLERLSRTGLVPALFEAELSGALPVRLPEALEGLEFHGIADRVDVDSDGRRYQVVDYKTRRRRRPLAALVRQARMHQPGIYAELARSALPRGEWALAGSHVYALEPKDGESPADEYGGEAWAADKAGVFKAMSAYIDEIAAGRFLIHPEDDAFGHCSNCSYAGVCRKSHGRSRARAEAAWARSPMAAAQGGGE